MTRREFAKLSVATLGGTALAAAFDSRWKLGVITDEVDFDLSRVLSDFYPKYGLKWAEFRYLTLDGKRCYVYNDATPQQLKSVRKQLDDAGVKLSVLDTAVYKIALPGTTPVGEHPNDLHPAQGEYSRQMDDLKKAAEASHILGAEHVRVFTFKRVAEPSAIFDRVVEEMNKAIKVAKQEDIVMVMENEFDCNVATGAESAAFFRAIPDRTLMHNWDPGNCFEAGEQPFPKAWDEIDHSRIAHMHLKDAKGKKWMPIGSGEIDFVGQFKALEQIGYSGTMSLETHYRNSKNDLYTSSVESMDGLMKVLQKV